MPSGIYKRTKEHLLNMSISRSNLKYSKSSYDSRRLNNGVYWKGEDAKYCAKHEWIKKYYGKSNSCEIGDATCQGRFEWSNKDHKYRRNRMDWWMLCCSHHKRYDIKTFKIVPWNKGNKNNFSWLWLKKEGLLR